MKICVQDFCVAVVSFPLDIYLGVELLGHVVTVFNPLRNFQTLFLSG